MAAEDWYRHRVWSVEVEQAFRTKLKRARKRADYLRIQASYLTESAPEVALTLLQEYFALGDHFDLAQAYCAQARALLSLHRPDDAFIAYEAALQREIDAPKVKTQAYLDYPMAVWTSGAGERRQRALEVLDTHHDRLLFPVDHYRWRGLRAIFLAKAGFLAEAIDEAKLALEASHVTTSGLQYHPDIGLVGTTQDTFGRLVREIAESSAPGLFGSLLRRFAPSARRPRGSSRR